MEQFVRGAVVLAGAQLSLVGGWELSTTELPQTTHMKMKSPPAFVATALVCTTHFPTTISRSNNNIYNSELYQFTASSSEFNKDYSKYQVDDDCDAKARSQFGTKSYWDSMYEGMGEFPADEYSWYYNCFDMIKPFLQEYIHDAASESLTLQKSELSILIPGCGNDSLILDLYNAGYRCLSAFDYSSGAIDRQRELLSYLPAGSVLDKVKLRVEDARSLPMEWTESFDVVIEKGALDAIYLSGEGSLEKSVIEIARVIKRGGLCISCSGVIPELLRRDCFVEAEWEWLRDGSNDLKAGCFVLRRR